MHINLQVEGSLETRLLNYLAEHLEINRTALCRMLLSRWLDEVDQSNKLNQEEDDES